MDIRITKEEFTKLYMDTSKTVKQLAVQLNVSENMVIRAAKKLNLSRRTPTNRLIIE